MHYLSTSIRKVSLLCFFLLCIGCIIYFRQNLTLYQLRESTSHKNLYFLPAPKTLGRFSLGYRTLLADLVWLRGLLYVGSHFTQKGALNWLPQYVDAIIHLDPKLRKAYVWGATLLLYNRSKVYRKHVLKSIQFLRMGRKQFPNDYYFPKALGFSYFHEIKLLHRSPSGLKQDHLTYCKKGKAPWSNRIKLIKQIRRCLKKIGAGYLMEASTKHNAPEHLVLLAASLMNKTGSKHLVICHHLLDVLWRSHKKVRKKLRSQLKRYCGPKELRIILCQKRLFHQRWKHHYPYIAPSLFMQLDLPPFLEKSNPVQANALNLSQERCLNTPSN